MTTQYFSHDVSAQRDDKCVKLLQTLGWKGYGIFWGIIERLHEQESCSLEYNPKGLAWSLHVEEKFLVRVLTEFDLFVFSEDGTTFWSESAKKRREMRYAKSKYSYKNESSKDGSKPKRGPGRPRKNPLPVITEPEKSVETLDNTQSVIESINNASDTQNVVKTPQNVVESVSEVSTQESVAVTEILNCNDSDSVIPVESNENEPIVPSEQIVTIWNKIFEGTRQTYRGFCLDPISYQRANESLSNGYTLTEIEKAFRIARRDTFCWLLKDVLKSDNLQRLLIKGDKKNDVTSSKSNIRSYSNDDEITPNWDEGIDWSQFERPTQFESENPAGLHVENLS